MLAHDVDEAGVRRGRQQVLAPHPERGDWRHVIDASPHGRRPTRRRSAGASGAPRIATFVRAHAGANRDAIPANDASCGRAATLEGGAHVAKVTMPQLGESVAEGTIGKWLKQPGDTVAKYEPLLEVITDKVNAEVPSPFAGVLKEILAEEGATVPNNAEIAVIETGRGRRRPRCRARRRRRAQPAAAEATGTPKVEARPTRTPPAPTGTAAPAPAAPRSPSVAERAPPRRPHPPPRPPAPAATGDANARMTPAVRRLLREHELRPRRSSAPARAVGSPATTCSPMSSRCAPANRHRPRRHRRSRPGGRPRTRTDGAPAARPPAGRDAERRASSSPPGPTRSSSR